VEELSVADTDPFSTPPKSTGTKSEEDDGLKRDRWGRYLLPDPDTGVERGWTRVTTLAKSASDTFTLDRWGLRMALKGLMSRPDLQALVASTPLEEKKKLNDLGQQCKDAMAIAARANLGTALHSFTEQADEARTTGKPTPEIPAPWRYDVEAYVKALDQAGITVLPQYIERITVVPEVEAAGTMDRIVQLPNGQLVIGDLKTGEDLSYGWSEIAIQLALYAHGRGLWNRKEQKWDEMPEVSKTKALVFHLPYGQKRCELYWLNIKKGWEGAHLCYEVRKWRSLEGMSKKVEL
jgi:hypothetical protein